MIQFAFRQILFRHVSAQVFKALHISSLSCKRLCYRIFVYCTRLLENYSMRYC